MRKSGGGFTTYAPQACGSLRSHYHMLALLRRSRYQSVRAQLEFSFDLMKYILDCASVDNISEFWDLYIEVVSPEGVEYFGRNLNALWDALHAGGPGYPGNESCTIKVINTKLLKQLDDGVFYDGLKQVSYDLKTDPGSSIKFVVE